MCVTYTHIHTVRTLGDVEVMTDFVTDIALHFSASVPEEQREEGATGHKLGVWVGGGTQKGRRILEMHKGL